MSDTVFFIIIKIPENAKTHYGGYVFSRCTFFFSHQIHNLHALVFKQAMTYPRPVDISFSSLMLGYNHGAVQVEVVVRGIILEEKTRPLARIDDSRGYSSNRETPEYKLYTASLS
jgi:hypothetical protein